MMSETLTKKLEKLVKVQEQLCAEVMRLKAERDAAYAAGQKAERERLAEKIKTVGEVFDRLQRQFPDDFLEDKR